MNSFRKGPSDGIQYCLRGEVGGVEQLFTLKPGDNQLGALDTNEVTVPLAGVSRVHARLRLGDGGLDVVDLESKNGTFVNGQRIERATVEVGSDLRFGPVALRFEEFHRDDGELAISLDYSSTEQTATFAVQEVPFKTGTQISSLSRQWLILAEQFQERLLTPGEGDWNGALGLLVEEMHLETACVLELPDDGTPIVLHAAGPHEDEAAQELKRLLRPFHDRPPSREIYFDTLTDGRGSALTVAAVRNAGQDPLSLALWGRFPGRLESELFLRLLLRMVEQMRPQRKIEEGPAPTQYPGLTVPEDYVYGCSEAMRKIYELMQTLAQGDLPILIIGETGVGKEYLAQILHESSPRRRGPFVAINCAAIPSDLLEAELFGIGGGVATGVSARKGRFQLADGGTLFLDEIGDMSADLQAKLLRALQEKEVHPLGLEPVKVDVRVLGATNQELVHRIGDGSFRADLYYRLAGYVLEIPPLRERKDDIPPLVEHFLRQCAAELNRQIRGLTVHALRLLTEYPWPGNVRELSNEVRRAVYLCPEHRTIESATLSKTLRQHFESEGLPEEPAGAGDGAPRDPSAEGDSLPAPIGLGLDSLNLEQLENMAILEALRRCRDNQVQAAKLLGISRQKLRRRMERLGQLKSSKVARGGSIKAS
ncbi:MAG: sigma 54-interacting transcriptional regulator [Acidobacteriota bacterium]